MSESNLIKKIFLDFPKKKLFRNNRGVGWVGNVKQGVAENGKPVTVIYQARPIYYGLPQVKKHEKPSDPKGSDIIGWEPVIITQDMVGQKIAQFVAIEVKTLAYRKATEGQMNFLRAVKRDGGQAVIIHEKENDTYFIEQI